LNPLKPLNPLNPLNAINEILGTHWPGWSALIRRHRRQEIGESHFLVKAPELESIR
jgi:hypothetical protein